MKTTVRSGLNRALALWLAVLLALSVLPVAALAADSAAGSQEELFSAVGEAEAGDTVKLTASVELTEPLTIDKKITIELGEGVVLSAKYGVETADPFAAVIVKAHGELTLTGRGTVRPAEDADEEAEHRTYAIVMEDGAKLKLDGEVNVTAKNDDESSYLISYTGSTALTLKTSGSLSGGACGVKAGSSVSGSVTVDMAGTISSGVAMDLGGTPAVSIVRADLQGRSGGRALSSELKFNAIIDPAQTHITADGTLYTTADLDQTPPAALRLVFAAGATQDPEPEPPQILPPAAPADPAWQDATARWSAVEDADGYQLELYKDGTADENKLGETPSVSGTEKDLSYETRFNGSYYFRVRAVKGELTGEWSDFSGAFENIVVITISAPTDLALDGTAATWQSDNPSASYKIQLYYNGEASGDPVDCTALTCDLTDSITADGSYTFTVQAILGEYSSDWSEQSPAYVKETPVVVPVPTDLAWDGTTATWQGSDASSGYKVQLYFNGEASGDPVDCAALTYDFTDSITADGSYTFAVRAVQGEHASDWSEQSPAYVKETPPAVFTVTLTEGTGYSLAPVHGSSLTVNAGADFNFTVTVAAGYVKSDDFAVKTNGTALTAVNGVYTISDIQANQTVTVEGVTLKPADPEPEPLGTSSDLGWNGTKALWSSVPGAKSYSLQLYFNGTADANKSGSPIAVTGTSYELSSAMNQDGTWYYKVQALDGDRSGDWSAASTGHLRDTVAPTVTSYPETKRDSETQASVYFSSSEAGSFWAYLSTSGTAPEVGTIVNGKDPNGSCNAGEKKKITVTLQNKDAIYLYIVVKDRSGNASTPHRIAISAYTAPSVSPSPSPSASPSPSPTTTAATVTYTVTLNGGTGYTIAAANGSKSPVNAGGSFSFTVTIANSYSRDTGFAVKANGVTLASSNGVYTISNINANQNVTVTGVTYVQPQSNPVSVPTSPTITTTLLPSASVGKAYTQQLAANGGGTITWSYSGNLPAGMTFSNTGLLSGTPTAEGSYRLTVKASNSTGSATRQMTLVVTGVSYNVTQGANASWTSGSEDGLTFRGNGKTGFTVSIDGTTVPEKDLTYSEDKASVTVSPDYLGSLTTGSHTVTLVYPDGNAKAKFTVKGQERSVAAAITAQPQSTEANEGDNVTFTVTASGSGVLKFQWQVDKNDGAGWTDIEGADKALFTVEKITPEQSGWKYRCVVTNNEGKAESNGATLTVKEELGTVTASPEPETPAKKRSIGRILLPLLLIGAAGGLGGGLYFYFRRRSDSFDDYDE